MPKKKNDLLNKRFGKWVVVSQAESKEKYNGTVIYWNCICDCRKIKKVRSADLTGGRSTSCGCMRIEAYTRACRIHGMSKTSEYKIWLQMKSRCKLTTYIQRKDYSGRGISVCERWYNSFENFFSDMGERPSKNHSIERKDNDGNYEPSNCYWGTRAEQSRNTRRSVWIEYNGKKMVLKDWATKLNLNETSIRRWLKKMTMAEMISKYCK